MSGKHRARNYLRSATAGVLAIAAASVAYIAVEQSANAQNFDAGCSAVALNAAGPSPVTLAYANKQYNPCDTDAKALLSATATVIPTPLGIGATKATLSAVSSKTSEGFNYYDYAYEVKASSDIAKLTITGPGIYVVATGIHSDVTIKDFDGATVTTANSWIATLKVNGVTVNVLKNTPIVVPIGLRIALYLNYRSVGQTAGQALPIGVTFPDHRYYLTLAQSQAQLGGFDCNCS